MTVLKTKKQAEALANLRGNSDFAAVLGMLEEHEKAQVEKLTKGIEPHTLYRLQGALGVIGELRAAYLSAPDMIPKLK